MRAASSEASLATSSASTPRLRTSAHRVDWTRDYTRAGKADIQTRDAEPPNITELKRNPGNFGQELQAGRQALEFRVQTSRHSLK